MGTSKAYAGALSVSLPFVVEASRKTRRDSWGRETDSTSSWEELQGPTAKRIDGRRGGELGPFL